MIEITGKHRASIFLPAADITPSPDTVSKLLNLFKEEGLLPNTFQEIGAQGLTPTPRLWLNTPNNEWAIHFASNRIDIEQNPVDENGSNIGSSSDFKNTAHEYFTRILSEFNKKFNRISLVTSGLTKQFSEDKLNEICQKLFVLIPKYIDNPPFEWNSRLVSRQNITIDDLKEVLNIITNINRIRGQIINNNKILEFDRIELSIEINTIAENPELRFTNNSLQGFFDKAISIQDGLLTEIEEHIVG